LYVFCLAVFSLDGDPSSTLYQDLMTFLKAKIYLDEKNDE